MKNNLSITVRWNFLNRPSSQKTKLTRSSSGSVQALGSPGQSRVCRWGTLIKIAASDMWTRCPSAVIVSSSGCYITLLCSQGFSSDRREPCRADLDLSQLFTLLKWCSELTWGLVWPRGLQHSQLYYKRAFWTNSATHKELAVPWSSELAAGRLYPRAEMFTAVMSSDLPLYKPELSWGVLSEPQKHST